MMLQAADMEALWERLAQAVDEAGPERDRLMLAKMVLLFADALGDAPHAHALIATALENLS